MRQYVIFNKLTGKVRIKIGLSDNENIGMHLQTGEAGLETAFDVRTQRIDVSGPEPIIVTAPLPTPPTADELEIEASRDFLSAHQILNATPTQIDSYVENNVTDLASAKEFLKLLTKVAVYGVRQ